MQKVIFFSIIIFLLSCEHSKDESDGGDLRALITLEETFEVQERTLKYILIDSVTDSLLELRVTESYQLLDSIRNKLISESGGFEEGYAEEYTHTLKNKEFLGSFDVIQSSFVNNQFQQTINAVTERIHELDTNYYKILIFQAADDPIMRQHPDWENLKYRYYFDYFKDLNLVQSLSLLQQIKLWIINEQLEYYIRIKT